jgi:predicted Fe-S protein YdhL (DUF1289 family)
MLRALSDPLMTAIESPCNQVCAVDPRSGLCIGCGRSIAEIGRWAQYSADERRRIMAELPGRLAGCGKAAKVPAGST